MKVLNFYKKYENNYIFEGEKREKYNRSIRKWLILSCFSVVFPFFITLITDGYDGRFSIVDVINNGDLILLSFSLTIPSTLDLMEAQKYKKEKSDSLSLCRCLCLFIIVIQTLFYALVRTHNTKLITNLISTTSILIVSIYICRYSIFCTFANSIEEGEDEYEYR